MCINLQCVLWNFGEFLGEEADEPKTDYVLLPRRYDVFASSWNFRIHEEEDEQKKVCLFPSRQYDTYISKKHLIESHKRDLF